MKTRNIQGIGDAESDAHVNIPEVANKANTRFEMGIVAAGHWLTVSQIVLEFHLHVNIFPIIKHPLKYLKVL